MKRSEKINSALEILDYKLNKKYLALAELMKYKIESEKKLQELISYKNKYDSIHNNKSEHHITSIQIQHNLMNKLQQAIMVQRDNVTELENKVNYEINLLKKDQAQTKALDVLVSRYHQSEKKILERNEQKEQDSQIHALLKIKGSL